MTSECGEAFLTAREELLRELPIHPETFGRMAVEAANVEAIVDVMHGTRSKSKARIQGFRDYTAQQLDGVRDEIASFEPDEASVINGYLNLSAPLIFHRAIPDQEITWTQWLSGSGIAPEDAASDAQLTNFLQWHVDYIARQQEHAEFTSELASLKEDYKKDVSDAITDGNLSQAARFAVENVDRAPVFIGDVFMTTMRDCGGFYRPEGGEVTVAQGIGFTRRAALNFLLDSLEDKYYHEETHAEVESSIHGSPLNGRWIREALTEHTSRSLLEGEFDIVKPADRTEKNMIYADERTLLGVILEQGSYRIDPALATRAFSGTKAEQEEFLNALDDSWGEEDFLRYLTDRIQTYTELFESKDDADKALTAELTEAMPIVEGMKAEQMAIIFMTMKLPDLRAKEASI